MHHSSISSSEDKVSKSRLAIKTLLVFSPVLLFLLIFEISMFITGETVPISYISSSNCDYDKESSTLFMRKYFDQGLFAYKFNQIKNIKPSILSLGTSRVMQFRKEMFNKNSTKFFNGGGMIQNLDDLELFLKNDQIVKDLKVIILGVELWWFNEKFMITSQKRNFLEEIKRDDALDGFAHANIFRLSIFKMLNLKKYVNAPGLGDYRDIFRKKKKDNHYGILANQKSTGFRIDGSYKYATALPNDEVGWKFIDREKPPVLKRVKLNSGGFIATSDLSEKRMEQFKRIMEKCRKEKILLLTFLPPFPENVIKELNINPGTNEIWIKYRKIVPEMIRKEGYYCIDASRTSFMGLDDRCMLDGFHALETFHVKLLLKMNEVCNDNRLNISREYLEKIVRNSGTNYWYPVY